MRPDTPTNPIARLATALLVVGAAFVAVACAGMETPAQEAAEDEATRASYYEESAKTYYDGGRYENAAIMWRRVLEVRPDDQWAKFGLAKSLHMSGDVRELRQAEVILQEILPLDWSHPTRGNVRFEVQTTLASVYSDLADFYDRDVRALERRLERDPNADAAVLRQQLARQQQMRNDLLRKSVPLFQQVLTQSPENPYALAGLAKANLLAGDEQAGIGYARRYIALSERSQQGWRRRMEQWRELARSEGAQVTPEQRAHFVQKIQGARKKEIGMRLLLGSVHMRREEFSDAIAQYDAVLGIDPSQPAAVLERGQAYAALGLYREAADDLEEYLKLTHPRDDRLARLNAAELLDRYRRLAGSQPFLQPTGDGAGAPPAAPVPAPRGGPPAGPPAGDQAWGSPDGSSVPPAGR